MSARPTDSVIRRRVSRLLATPAAPALLLAGIVAAPSADAATRTWIGGNADWNLRRRR